MKTSNLNSNRTGPVPDKNALWRNETETFEHVLLVNNNIESESVTESVGHGGKDGGGGGGGVALSDAQS